MSSASRGSSANKGLSDHEVVRLQADQKNADIDEQNRQLKNNLQYLVFQIFLLVSDADGEIDSKEITAFRDFLSNRKLNCSNSYTKRLFHVTLKNFVLLMDQYRRERIVKDLEMVEQTMMLVGKIVPAEMMMAICSDLKNLGEAVAKASGGFIGLGSKVSKEEAAVMGDLKTIYQNAIAESREQKKPKKTKKR